MNWTQEQIQALRFKAETDVEAQYEMGWRSAIGMGLPLNDAEAIRWLRKAAAAGHRLAQNNLGARYASGDGVPRDWIEAYLWFHRAATQGDRKAGKNRDSIQKHMSAAQLDKAKSILSQS